MEQQIKNDKCCKAQNEKCGTDHNSCQCQENPPTEKHINDKEFNKNKMPTIKMHHEAYKKIMNSNIIYSLIFVIKHKYQNIIIFVIDIS